MSYPIEIKYVIGHLNPNKKYTCPDCNIPMDRFNKTHSPTSQCYHSICPKCYLEYCDYAHSYWYSKPKNKDVIQEVSLP